MGAASPLADFYESDGMKRRGTVLALSGIKGIGRVALMRRLLLNNPEAAIIRILDLRCRHKMREYLAFGNRQVSMG